MLPSGSALGPYEILGPLGAGGMGEVYRARDSRLGRTVALKVMLSDMASDPSLLSRFEREARAASALNHPNIISVFDVGRANERAFIVSELVDGESLRATVKRGPVPIRKLLDIAIQLADGLAAAHAAGITHRDLKPENVMLTKEGRLKVLDFGLAKQAPVATGEHDATVPATTQPGTAMGTPSYMSPEQALGQHVDYRSDQFSFGIMLYELASAKKPFARNDSVRIMAAIVAEEPAPLDVGLPPPLMWIIERCLAKEPAQRYDSTRDLYRELHDLREHLSDVMSSVKVAALAKRARWILPALAIPAALAAGFFVSSIFFPRGGVDLTRYRFKPLVVDHEHQTGSAWSPDGKNIAYVADVDGVDQLFVRAAESATPEQITKLPSSVVQPVWSGDSRRIFFLVSTTMLQQPRDLYSVPASGGQAEVLLHDIANGLTVSPDNQTLASTGVDDASVLQIWISSPPGSPKKLLAPNPFARKQPRNAPILHFSPDGSKLLFFSDAQDGRQAWLIPYPPGDGKKPRQIFKNMPFNSLPPTYSWMPDSRHVVVSLERVLGQPAHLWMADTEKETFEQLTAGNEGEEHPAVSPDGKKIAYSAGHRNYDVVEVPVTGGAAAPLLASQRSELMPAWSTAGDQMVYVTDRTGEPEIWIKSSHGWDRPIVTTKDFPKEATTNFISPVFSPDGKRIAFSRADEKSASIWISSVTGGSPTRLTSATTIEHPPAWSSDGNWLAYAGGKTGAFGLNKAKVGSSHAPEMLVSPAQLFVPDWSPDGQWITCLVGSQWYVVSPDGQKKKPLGALRTPHLVWSKTEKDVLYGIRRENGKPAMFSVNADTGDVKILGNAGEDMPASWVNPAIRLSLSGDGKKVAFGVSRPSSEIWVFEGFGNK